MAYFATFYSYKGGVGRTLALANVAWLLANHPSEPARVLAVDFDLGAPGLFQVFGMSGTKRSPGLVDYVSSYLQKAEIPDVTQFIHKTAYKNIDILPAGKMDSHYQRRLESIDWRDLYEGAFGYEMIERLKSDISAIRPEYDYVLVDSLTGYTDVGGICVNQLPDLLILLFRLNQQNLDGIEKVYHNAINTHEEETKSIIPVITPSWPFIDEAATLWINKAQKIFSQNKLLEISFDSSLSFGERIISKDVSRLPLASKLLEDYRRLAAQIREKNPVDCLTIWNNIQRGTTRTLVDPFDLYLSLLKRRPQVLEYWSGLRSSRYYPWIGPVSGKPSQSWERLMSFVNQESESGNKFALLARAGLHEEKDIASSRIKAIADLDRALQIDPLFIDALIERGQLAFHQRRYEDAVHDFSACLEIPQIERGFPRSNIEAKLAETHLRMFDGKSALLIIGSAIERDGSDLDFYRIRARALYLEGDYSAALADSRRFAKFDRPGQPGSLLPSQILAAMGHIDEAAKELRAFSSEDRDVSEANLAEAYLAVDPGNTITLLNAQAVKTPPAIRYLLTRLARILSGEQLRNIAPESGFENSERIDPERWNFFEVIALLRAKERAGQLSAETIQLAYDVIQSAADPIEFSLIQRSRAAMTST